MIFICDIAIYYIINLPQCQEREETQVEPKLIEEE